MTKRCAYLSAILLLGCVGQALAVYNPQTGRFLSRDPRGELGFEVLQRASGATLPSTGLVLDRQSASTALSGQDRGRIFNRRGIDTTRLGAISASRKKDDDKYVFVMNDPIDLIDPLGLFVNVGPTPGQDALEGIGGELRSVIDVALTVRARFNQMRNEYQCCHNGRLVDLGNYDGVCTGTERNWTVAHRITGCELKAAGVSGSITELANVMNEVVELIRGEPGRFSTWSSYWDDTVSDMAAVAAGFNTDGIDCFARFVPRECHLISHGASGGW